jgi:hypothetical protein
LFVIDVVCLSCCLWQGVRVLVSRVLVGRACRVRSDTIPNAGHPRG